MKKSLMLLTLLNTQLICTKSQIVDLADAKSAALECSEAQMASLKKQAFVPTSALDKSKENFEQCVDAKLKEKSREEVEKVSWLNWVKINPVKTAAIGATVVIGGIMAGQAVLRFLFGKK